MSHDEEYFQQVREALEFVKSLAGGFVPKTVVVLGSGLGYVAEQIADPLVIETKKIPNWPQSTAPGHAGQIVLGKLEGRPVAVLKGRVHYYEGYNMRQITFPTRVMGMWGAGQYIATNAAGAVDYSLSPGDIVLVNDHINFMGDNPLIGPTEPRWNVRFPDMTYAYSRLLKKLFEKAASRSGILIRGGVYIAFTGPSYETPSEVRMARLLGASVVGMSTVPEVIVANAMRMETAVLSCVANLGAGMSGEKLTEEEVLAEMKASSERVGTLICGLMQELEKEKI